MNEEEFVADFIDNSAGIIFPLMKSLVSAARTKFVLFRLTVAKS